MKIGSYGSQEIASSDGYIVICTVTISWRQYPTRSDKFSVNLAIFSSIAQVNLCYNL